MNVVQALDGTSFDLDSIPQTLVYNGVNKVDYIQVVYRANTYRQTYGYTAGNMTSISGWIKQ